MKSFNELGIAPLLIEKLAAKSIREPTAIQAAVIPRILAGHNILFRSATGTGKTFAYLLPLVQRLFESTERVKNPALLICAPTYELCAQIKKEADFLLEAGPLKAILLTGSANISRQIDTIKKDKPAIVVGNPGRLAQLERMGKLKLRDIRYLVLDEADRLVADELYDESAAFLRQLPADRHTIACSATFTPRGRDRLLPLMGSEPFREEQDDNTVLKEKIEHWAFYSEGRRKIATLRSLIVAAEPSKALVFIDRAGQVGNIAGQLQHHKLPAAALFADMQKQDRKKAIDDFRAGRARILVTSDLAARGLDVPDITHVIALDVPQTADAYAHRAGRTARAGRHGVMATIGDDVELPRLAMLEKKMGIAVYPKELFRGAIRAPEPFDPDDDGLRD